MTLVQIAVGVLTLIVNAFFVGAEFALISVRRSQIEPRAQEGDRHARTLLWGLEHVSALMATAQLGIALCTLVLGVVAEPTIAHALEPLFDAIGIPPGLVHPIAFVIALTVATYLHMLIGEMVPKNIALAEPERTALALGPALVRLTRALRPIVFGINAFANALLRLLRVEPKGEVAAVFTDDELARLVKVSSAAGLLDERATERLQDALELGRHPVREVVVPAERVVHAPLGITPVELEQLAAESGFSRFPVIDRAGDIRGYLHVKDALAAGPRERPFPLAALRPITRVQVATPLDDVLASMRSTGAHLAAVTEPDGTLAGLVTLEDVLKELVGPAPAEGGAANAGEDAG
jgi:CBS domain containing-hemolysin-like protein